MSKPEDIPQDVRSAAWDLGIALLGPDTCSDEDLNTIARAIMAAKAEAYTDAADLAQRMGAVRKSQSEQAKTAKQPKGARYFESMAMSAFDVADAIRKRDVSTAYQNKNQED